MARQTFDMAAGKGALHLVSAWATANRLVLGQQGVDSQSHAPAEVPLEQVVGAPAKWHGAEEGLQAAKGEVGLGHFEMRSWVGWHHHLTLSLLALWFLALERRRLGKKSRR